METRTEGMGTGHMVGDTAERMQATAEQFKERARQAGERFGAAWENTRNNIQEKTLASARATDRTIRDNPYTSLGVAFGIGLLIGVLINRGR